MTEEEIRALSNVDLLKEYGNGVFLGWPDGERDYLIMRNEILSRMDTGTGHIDRVPMHPSEYRR